MIHADFIGTGCFAPGESPATIGVTPEGNWVLNPDRPGEQPFEKVAEAYAEHRIIPCNKLPEGYVTHQDYAMGLSAIVFVVGFALFLATAKVGL